MTMFFEILKQDHDNKATLFPGGIRERTSLLTDRGEVAVHMDAEERFLYPALEKHQEAKTVLKEAGKGGPPKTGAGSPR